MANKLWEDSFEKLAEMGVSAVKQTGKTIANVVNPLTLINGTDQSSPDSQSENPLQKMQDKKGIEQIEQGKSKGQDHTPLNFDKLNDSYKSQDQKELEEKRRQFQYVIGGTEKAIAEIKREKEEKKREEAYEEQQKKQEEMAAQQQGGGEEVAGKPKGVLGQARRKAKVDPMENKAQKGK